MSSIKQKLKQKILSKQELSLKDKALVKNIDNMTDKELLKMLLVERLNNIRPLIEKLEKKYLYGRASMEEVEQLKKLKKERKKILIKIKELNGTIDSDVKMDLFLIDVAGAVFDLAFDDYL